MATTQQLPALEPDSFYRVTQLAQLPGAAEALKSVYLHDVLELCRRGAWALELRQFMPPMSLRESVARLIEMGLIERADDPPAMPMFDPQRKVLPGRRQAANESRARAFA